MEETGGDGYKETADVAHGHTDGGENTAILGNVERLGLGVFLDGFLQSLTDLGGHISHHLAVLIGRRLVDFIINEGRQFAVRRPEGFGDTDGILDNFGDGGIPRNAGTVVEHTVLADLDIAGFTDGQRRNDGETFTAGLVGTVAENQEATAHIGHLFLIAHIADLDAKIAGTLVEIESAGLENGRFLYIIEVRESHIILEQGIEIAVEVEEVREFLHIRVFRLIAQVLGDKGGQALFDTGTGQRRNAGRIQTFDGSTGLGTHPRFVRGKRSLNFFPFFLT